MIYLLEWETNAYVISSADFHLGFLITLREPHMYVKVIMRWMFSLSLYHIILMFSAKFRTRKNLMQEEKVHGASLYTPHYSFSIVMLRSISIGLSL
jgi:hypothetical protein